MKIAISKPVLTIWTALFSVLVVAGGSGWAKRKPRVEVRQEFDRAQFMIMNLNRGKDSTGFYLQESLRTSRLMVRDLEKAQRQLEQADKSFAKSRGRPDDKYLSTAGARIAAAKAAAHELEKQLDGASDELKSSIHQVLLMEQP